MPHRSKRAPRVKLPRYVHGARPVSTGPVQYADTSHNPVSGLQPGYETGHVQSRSNTMSNRRNGGGSMSYNWSEGLAG